MAYGSYLFDEQYYLQQKLAQLQASGYTGYTTTAQVAAAIAAAGMTVEQHFQLYGDKEGISPNSFFNDQYYLEQKAQQCGMTVTELRQAITAAGLGIYEHYELYGFSEQLNGQYLNPSTSFDDNAYLAAKAAQSGLTVAQVVTAFQAAGLSPIDHWAKYGQYENLSYNPVQQTGTFNLTVNTDVATANVFEAGLAWSPGGNDRLNTLQDEDKLTGAGTNPTLNATLGNANDNGGTTITPTLTGVETVNVAFTGSGGTAVNVLDLQDATGVDAVNITRISDPNNNVWINNLTAVPANLSLSNTNSPAALVAFTFTTGAVNGPSDETTMTLNNATVGTLRIEQNSVNPTEGIETINLVSSGSANAVGVLQAEDLQTLNISGDQNLVLGTVSPVRNAATTVIEATNYTTGFRNVSGSLSAIDGSAATGNLDVTLGAELNATKDNTTGTPVNMVVKGGSGDDVFRIAADVNVDAGDSFDGGTGANKMVLYGGANQTLNGTVANVQALEIRAGHDAVAGDLITVDASKVTALATTYVRNEGMNPVTLNPALDPMIVTLNNMTAAQAQAITIAHGTTLNNGITSNTINVNKTTSTAIGVTVVNPSNGDSNADPRFNFIVASDSTTVKNVTLTDSDSESNTVSLRATNVAATSRTDLAATSLTIAGAGTAGTFFNLDAAANVAGKGLGLDTSGLANDTKVTDTVLGGLTLANVFLDPVGVANVERYNSTTITSTTASDTIIRLDSGVDAKNNPINQTITMGAGNDSVIFDAQANQTAGLTIGDTVKGGAGTDTLYIDGNSAGQIQLGASEFKNVSGFENVRLGQSAGGYRLTITNDFVASTDSGNNLTIINNDGLVGDNAETNATVDLSGLGLTQIVNFYGANGTVLTPQTNSNHLILGDASANNNGIFNGGDAQLNSVAFAANANVYEVRNTADVTAQDLANVSNFGTVRFSNTLALTQNLNLTLTDAVVDKMAQASHTATNLSRERLIVQGVDNLNVAGATSTISLTAGTVSNAFNLDVLLGRGTDNVTSGAGDDVFVMYGNYFAGFYGNDNDVNYNMNSLANNTIGAMMCTDTVNGGAGTDTLVTYGAINTVGATLTNIENWVAHSAVVMTLSQWKALVAANAVGATVLTFDGPGTHQLTITNDGTGGSVDLSQIRLTGGNLIYDLTSVGGAIGTTNAVDIVNPLSHATVGIVGTNPSDNTTASNFVSFKAGGTYTGTAGLNDIFIGTTANLSGTKITGTAADNETLQLTDVAAGLLTLNDGAAGGLLLANLDNLVLANGTNKIAFAAGTGIKNVTGGAGDDTITVTNMTPAGTVNLGAGNDTLNIGTADPAIVGSTYNGESGSNTINVAGTTDLSTATITNFQTLNATAAGETITASVAQINGFTTITDLGGSADLKLAVKDAGALNLLGTNFTDVDEIDFVAVGGNSLSIKGAELGTGNVAKIVGGGGNDSLTVTLNGANLDLTTTPYSAVGVESIVFTGATATTAGNALKFSATVATNAGLSLVDVSGISVGGATITLGALATANQTVKAHNGVADTITGSTAVGSSDNLVLDNGDSFDNNTAAALLNVSAYAQAATSGVDHGESIITVKTTADMTGHGHFTFYDATGNLVYVNAIGGFSTTAVNANVANSGLDTIIDVDVNHDGVFGVGDTRILVQGQNLVSPTAAGGMINF